MRDFCEACERNKAPILGVLTECFADRQAVLEIGSGSGQHALYLAPRLAHLRWYPSERGERLAVLRHNLQEAGACNHEGASSPNLQLPLELDVGAARWPSLAVDAVFSANTLHIMSWEEVQAFLRGVAGQLTAGGLLAVYGPFRYGERHTSEGNARFDQLLRAQGEGGIRDAHEVDRLAAIQGLRAEDDIAMPANNRLRLWRRQP
ncbi:DUF938 domain-containing protein [Motiliproteus sp. SC1-56]|uniref:DUF938 domain-containing protein n=1 Tax=Motiliproteus sp. SC1-56 TaxID=2799565 RepID=UPI001A8C5C10